MAAYNTPPDLVEQFEGILRRYVERALKEYEDAVDRSDLTRATNITYKRHANTFVRWMRGEFTPGGTL